MADGNIFISYRRGPDSNAAGRLYDRLERSSTARGCSSISTRSRWVWISREHIDGEVAKCDVQLVVIGPGWLEEIERLLRPRRLGADRDRGGSDPPGYPGNPRFVRRGRDASVRRSAPEPARPGAPQCDCREPRKFRTDCGRAADPDPSGPAEAHSRARRQQRAPRGFGRTTRCGRQRRRGATHAKPRQISVAGSGPDGAQKSPNQTGKSFDRPEKEQETRQSRQISQPDSGGASFGPAHSSLRASAESSSGFLWKRQQFLIRLPATQWNRVGEDVCASESGYVGSTRSVFSQSKQSCFQSCFEKWDCYGDTLLADSEDTCFLHLDPIFGTLRRENLTLSASCYRRRD